jgi:alanine racemase
VALPHEARAVRAAVPGAVIYVLSGLSPGAGPILWDVKARPVLGSVAEIEEWGAFCRSNNLDGDAAIHVDTGMNRLGLSLDEAGLIAERAADGALGFKPALVMSHLACADEPAHALNRRQLDAFTAIRNRFPGVRASLANSSASLTGGDYLFDLCRPGFALYGGNPIPASDNPMKPVVRLQARIVQIRTAAAGETVGYGATQTLRRPSRLAILSLGYADGLLRAAGSSDTSKGTDAVIAGRRWPLAGRISMDLCAVDITDLPAGAVKRGDYATIIGDGIGIDDVARAAGTIGYEILTSLGSRFNRTYKS